MVALTTVLLIAACDSSSDDTTPADTGTSPSACPPGSGPSDGPGGDCGGAPPSGAGGGYGSDQLEPDEEPTGFTPRGTDLDGAGVMGAPGDVLPPSPSGEAVAPAGFLPGR